jgi:hypothetical protein
MQESTKHLEEFQVRASGVALRVFYGRLKTKLANLSAAEAKKSGQAGYEKVSLVLKNGFIYVTVVMHSTVLTLLLLLLAACCRLLLAAAFAA